MPIPMFGGPHKKRLTDLRVRRKSLTKMALTIPCRNTATASIGEYVEYVERHVDLRDPDSIAASAPMLRALANDRVLVVKKLNERIQSFLSDGAMPSAQTLLLARSQGFYVRANIWPAIADMVNGRAYQDQFAYNIAHDHNFTFMTVGYLGPGYETEIYEYDPDSIEGYVGESVELRFLEKVRFAAGTVMLYRASRDVHIQYAPEELTITLNLMVSLPEVRLRDQYYFDLVKRTISSYPAQLQATNRVSFVNLAGYIGNGDTQELLEILAHRHPCRRTRLTAFAALCKQQPQRETEIWTSAVNDSAPLVANMARQRLRALDSA